MALQIIATSYPNPNARSYSLNDNGQRMSESLTARVFSPPFRVLGQSWYEVGIPGRTMLSGIFKGIGGSISLIFLRPEELLVVKKVSADWDEIDHCVIEAARKAFNPKAKD